MRNKHIIERNIKLEIKIAKGTYAYITRNINESEIILANNTRYQILDSSLGLNKVIFIYIGILKWEWKNYILNFIIINKES